MYSRQELRVVEQNYSFATGTKEEDIESSRKTVINMEQRVINQIDR